MQLELGINTCFAVKRWPLPTDWAPIVSERLGLRLVEHSFDLVDIAGGSLAEESAAVASAARQHGLSVRSTFTGLAAYSSNMLLSPDPATRASAQAWFGRAIAFSESIGAIATGGHIGHIRCASGTTRTSAPSDGRVCALPFASWPPMPARRASRRSSWRTWPLPASRRQLR